MHIDGIKITQKMLTRLSTDSIPEPNSGCWLWMGATVPRGYGKLSVSLGDRKMVYVYAHRLAFAVKHGYWPEMVRHRCDNPYCVNPDHLEGGTHEDNVADKVARNRQTKGTAIHNALLDEHDVRSIVLFLLKTKESASSIARRFRISGSVITNIKDGSTWRHVTGDACIEEMLSVRPKSLEVSQ